MALREDRLEEQQIRPNYYRVAVSEADTREPVAIECFDLIDALFNGDFYLGNALKYLWRLGRKNGASKVEDLKKVRTYIDQAIARVEEETP